MQEQRDAPGLMEVRFKRANRPGRRGVPVQEWRSVRTGRTFEVEEGHAFAPSDALNEGQQGYLRHVSGIPVVVADPADAPVDPLRGAPRGPLGEPGPAAGPPRAPQGRDRPWFAWALGAALLLAVLWTLLR